MQMRTYMKGETLFGDFSNTEWCDIFITQWNNVARREGVVYDATFDAFAQIYLCVRHITATWHNISQGLRPANERQRYFVTGKVAILFWVTNYIRSVNTRYGSIYIIKCITLKWWFVYAYILKVTCSWRYFHWQYYLFLWLFYITRKKETVFNQT